MTVIVPESREPFIRDLVKSGTFASESEVIEEALQLLEARVRQSTSDPQRAPAAARKPIWERIAELREQVPTEEWDKVPTDGSKQLDHYIYGSPKRIDS